MYIIKARYNIYTHIYINIYTHCKIKTKVKYVFLYTILTKNIFVV